MCTTNGVKINWVFLADSLGLLTAAAQGHELQDKLNSTLEILHQQRVLNYHLQLQLSATSQPSKDPEPDLTVQKILQQEKKVPGLFLHYTNIKHSTFVSDISTVARIYKEEERS